MSNQQVVPLSPQKAGEIIEAVIIRGDLAALSPEERAKYYVRTCESVGLNPMTRPFEYITLNGKLQLYARKETTDQLRSIHNISVVDLAESERDGVFIVTAKVSKPSGRVDSAKGAVHIHKLQGDALANAIMKAETKAKRRATLSICGLGFLDESELETIPANGGNHQQIKRLPKKDARDVYTRMQAEVDATTSIQQLAEWEQTSAERMKVLPEDWEDFLLLRILEKRLDLRQHEPIQPAASDNSSLSPAVAEATVDIQDASASAPEPHKPPSASGPAAQPARAPDPVVTNTPRAGEPTHHTEARRQQAERNAAPDLMEIPPALDRRPAAAKLREDMAGVLESAPDADTYPARIRGLLAAIHGKAKACEDLTGLAEYQVECTGLVKGLATAYVLAASAIIETRRKQLADLNFNDPGDDWEQAIRDLDGAASSCEDAASLSNVKNNNLFPMKDKSPPEIYERAVAVYRTHVARLTEELTNLNAG